LPGPWRTHPGHTQLKPCPGRRSRSGTRPATAVTADPRPAPSKPSPCIPLGGIGFPHAKQAIRITRTRTLTTSGTTSRETAYLAISLPTTDAHPVDLQRWARAEWLIENLVHHVRDVTFRQDSHQARTGNGPAVLATLRNTAIGFHRTSGDTNIVRATRRANRRPWKLMPGRSPEWRCDGAF